MPDTVLRNYSCRTDLETRGLAIPPKLAVGDGALGFWAALAEIYPQTRPQRCWVHKVANVMNYLPKAVDCLTKDRGALFAFFEFPAEHWIHIRSSNVIESTFATIRHRTDCTKGCLTHAGMLAMMFKLSMSAEHGWRRLRGFEWLAKVIRGVMFRDGIEVRTEKRASLLRKPADSRRLINSPYTRFDNSSQLSAGTVIMERLRVWARRIKRDGVTLWFAYRHPQTPWLVKALCMFVVAYALSPIDFIPDFIPILGYFG